MFTCVSGTFFNGLVKKGVPAVNDILNFITNIGPVPKGFPEGFGRNSRDTIVCI